MANKKLNFWLIVFGVPLILIIGFVVFLKLYFTSEKLKSLIIPKIEASIHRTISVKDVGISIFPTFGIDVNELYISNPDSIDFKKETFFKAERILFSVKLLPLFKNQVEIKEILLKNPELYLEVNDKGIDNYSFGTTNDTSQTKSVKVNISKKTSLLLNNFKIENAKLEYLNFKDGTRFLISGYNQKTKVESGVNDERIYIFNELDISNLSYGDLNNYIIQNLPFHSEHSLSYFITKDELNIDTCLIMVNQLKSYCSGKISGILGEMNFDLNLKSHGNDLNGILGLIPEKYLTKKTNFESKANYSIDIRISGAMKDTSFPIISGKISLSDGLIKYVKLPKSITDINFSCLFEKSQNTSYLEINKLNLRMGKNAISGNITVKNFDAPYFNADMQGIINLTEIKDYYPLDAESKLSGIVEGAIKITGEVQKPENVKGQGKLVLKDVAFLSKDTEVQNISGEIVFNNDYINSKSIRLKLGKSDLESSFELKNYIGLINEKTKQKTKPYLRLNLNSNYLSTADIFKKQDQEQKEKQTDKSSPTILPDVDASINLNVKQFAMEKFTLDNLKGQINLTQPILQLKYLTFNIFEGDVKTEGKIEFKDINEKKFDLNLDIQAIQANSLLSKFTSFGNNIFGRMDFTATMSGSVDDTMAIIPKFLAGRGNVKILDGKLIGYPIMQKIGDFTGIDELKEVIFKEWTNSFTISDGKILLKDLKIKAFNTDLVVDGSQSFDGTVQMNVELKLSKELSNKINIGGTLGQFTSLFKDRDERVSVPLIVSGYYKKPAISLNTKQQKKQIETQLQQEIQKKKEEVKERVTQEVEKIVDTVKQKGMDELKKKAEDALKKLFKKP